MTPVFQTRFGTDGNCWAACLATVFDVPLESVDHCACNNPDWSEQTAKWLRARGLFSIEIATTCENGSLKYPFVAPPDGTICIISGKSPRGLAHVVVAKARLEDCGQAGKANLWFELVHDPYPELKGESLLNINMVIFFGAILSEQPRSST